MISLVFLFATQAKITVFAAASMANVLEEIKSEYIKVNPQQEIDFSFASSSVLARKLVKEHLHSCLFLRIKMDGFFSGKGGNCDR